MVPAGASPGCTGGAQVGQPFRPTCSPVVPARPGWEGDVSESQGESSVTVLCAWCGALLHQGGEAISHGICKDCAPALLEKIRERLRESEGQAERQHDATARRVPRQDSGDA